MQDHNQADCSPEDYRTLFEDQVHGLEFEHDLINRKITWLLTSQTVLFAALGLTLRAPSLTLVRVIGAIGLAISVLIGVGLIGNVLAKWFVHNDYNTLEGKVGGNQKVRWAMRGSQKLEFGVRSPLTYLGVAVDMAIPFAFALAWSAVLVLAGGIVNAATASLNP